MTTDLTILAFVTAEQDPQNDVRFLGAIRELNVSAHGRLQVLMLCQRRQEDEQDLVRLAASQPFDVQVVFPDHPRDATGYPVWDVIPAVRDVWDRVRGRYVSFAHTEYIHGPDRLAGTCDWLLTHRPAIALGNLRRITANRGTWATRVRDHKDPLNTCFAALLDAGHWDFVRAQWDLFGILPWVYWHPEPSLSDTHWWEDVFFADRDWLESLRFFSHGGKLPFQDIYDLVGPALQRLGRDNLAPVCPRLSRQVHDSCHILHPRLWGSFTPAMRAWFAEHAEEFAGTTMVRADLWDVICQPGKPDDERPGQAVDRFRRAPGGTVTRWLADFSAYLNNGGKASVEEYFRRRAGDR